MREDSHSSRLVPDSQRLNLSTVAPAHRQDAQREAIEIQEHECNSGCSRAIALLDQTACDQRHADSAANARQHDRPSSSDLVDVEVWRPAEDSVLREGHRSQDQGHVLAETQVLLKNVGKVIAQGIDSGLARGQRTAQMSD